MTLPGNGAPPPPCRGSPHWEFRLQTGVKSSRRSRLRSTGWEKVKCVALTPRMLEPTFVIAHVAQVR